MSKQDLILLYGGRSAEREVSVLSAESVMRAIDYQAFRFNLLYYAVRRFHPDASV